MGVGFWLPVHADEVVPAWLYPVNPPHETTTSTADGAVMHLSGSKEAFTQAQLTDLFYAPDWYPGTHGPAPEVVMRGRAPKVFACGYCHSPTGQGRPENAALAGLPADYIVQQLADFKNGSRHSASHGTDLPSQLMSQVAMNASAEDVQSAAQYFAAQTLLPRVHVIERAQVPKTHVGGWVYVADAGARKEPLAGRMLELAPDFARHEKRDDHLRYIAYVPPGSVAHGKLLATVGLHGVTGCGSCHGAELLGAGLAPPIAGRSPSYLLRQLVALKTGDRTGPRATLMKTIIATMDLEDMVAAAAYAASLPPSSTQPNKQGAAQKKLKATALVYDMRVVPPGSSVKSDAIAVALDHRDAYSAVVIYPYTSSNGQLTVGTPFAQQGSSQILDAK